MYTFNETVWLLELMDLISSFDHSVKTGYPEKRVGSSGIFRTIFGQDAMTFNPKLKWLHHYRKMAERRMFIFQRCAIPVRLNFSHFICRLRIFEVCESYIVRHSDTIALRMIKIAFLQVVGYSFDYSLKIHYWKIFSPTLILVLLRAS